MKHGWGAAALALLVAAVAAQAQTPAGAPQIRQVPRDAEFGVGTRHGFGLERRVQMYQWHVAGQGYASAWSTNPVDSSGFAPGYENPPGFPLRSRRWMSGQIVVDGVPLAPEVVEELGRWRPLRPDFAALPGNLAATFQPEGDGLGSAENPLAPRIGDLRITWRELVLPPLKDRVRLRDGAWRLVEPGAGTARGDADAPEPVASRQWIWFFGGAWWWIAGAVLVLLLGWLVARRR